MTSRCVVAQTDSEPLCDTGNGRDQSMLGTTHNQMSALTVVPALDEIAVNPAKATGLLPEVARALLARCVIVQGALIVPALAASAPGGAPVADDDDWITREAAATLLNVNSKWFTRRRGKLPFVKQLSPRKVMISKKGLLQWMGRRTA
jgi:hypothetical protein